MLMSPWPIWLCPAGGRKQIDEELRDTIFSIAQPMVNDDNHSVET
jgi:hypothetical protein